MKELKLIFLILILLISITGCNSFQMEPKENLKEGYIQANDNIQVDGMIMVKDNLYVYTGYEVPEKINEETTLGKITSVIDYLETPTENGQANFKIKGAKYAPYGDDMVVQIYDKWILFKNQKNMFSGFSVTNFSPLMDYLTEEEIFKVFRTIRKYMMVDENYKENLDKIIEKSFKECGIYNSSIIDWAISNLKITVTNPNDK